MAQTPFNILSSTDILSAHVNGLASAVNKVEQALNMKTTTVTNHTLSPVNDMDDLQLRYRIYEGTIRNWTSFTVKRNGIAVNESEYAAHGGFGAIVFNAQQNDTDVITVDATYVTSQSQTIEDINSKFNNFQLFPSLQIPGTYITHSLNGVPIGSLATGIDSGSKTLDIFPFFVSQPITVDQMMVIYEKTLGSTMMRMGIYSTKNGLPDQLLTQTGQVPNPATEPAAGSYVQHTGMLVPEITLQPGLYWMGRWQDGSGTTGISFRGLSWKDAINLGTSWGATIPNASQFTGFRDYGFGGFRVQVDYTDGLPTTLPALGSASSNLRYLERASFCSPFVRRKA